MYEKWCHENIKPKLIINIQENERGFTAFIAERKAANIRDETYIYTCIKINGLSVMNKAIKYRVYPTTEQSIMFAKTFGCCRKIYNLMLADKIAGYQATGKIPMVTPAMYKREYPYLKEVDSLALCNVQLHLQAAFENHLSRVRKKRTGFPRYKSEKHNRRSYTTNNRNGTVAVVNGSILLPKIGRVKAVIHRQPEDGWLLKSATVS